MSNQKKELKNQYNKLNEDIKNLKNQKKDLDARIKLTEDYKNMITQKKTIESHPSYQEMKKLNKLIALSADGLKKKELITEIRDLQEEAYDLLEELEEEQ